LNIIKEKDGQKKPAKRIIVNMQVFNSFYQPF